MLPQRGLGWKWLLAIEAAYWTEDSQIAIVRQLAYTKLSLSGKCDVEFFAEGRHNKLYLIRSTKGEFLFRVSLPVDPRYKTLREVATLNFVRQNTDIPVPRVFAYDASAENELGFEWIIMERMPGKQLSDRWREISFPKKEELVKRIARAVASVFHLRFKCLGSLYHSSASPSTNFEVYRMVLRTFFVKDRITYDLQRGPFKSSGEWLDALLLVQEKECESSFKAAEDEEDMKLANRMAANLRRLRVFIPSLFQPRTDDGPETTALCPQNLSDSNILVDENGDLSGIVDWERMSILPLWMFCDLPVFLRGTERRKRPQKEWYMRAARERAEYESQEAKGVAKDLGEKVKDTRDMVKVSEEVAKDTVEFAKDGENGVKVLEEAARDVEDAEDALEEEVGRDAGGAPDPNSPENLLRGDLEEYEKTLLRGVFAEEMRRIDPELAEIYFSPSNQRKADAEGAVSICGNCIDDGYVRRWLDRVERGEEARLMECAPPLDSPA